MTDRLYNEIEISKIEPDFSHQALCTNIKFGCFLFCVYFSDIYCGFYAFVTDRACERFHIHSVSECLRCKGVAECVERHVLALGSLKDGREFLSARTGIAWHIFVFIRRWEQPL